MQDRFCRADKHLADSCELFDLGKLPCAIQFNKIQQERIRQNGTIYKAFNKRKDQKTLILKAVLSFHMVVVRESTRKETFYN